MTNELIITRNEWFGTTEKKLIITDWQNFESTAQSRLGVSMEKTGIMMRILKFSSGDPLGEKHFVVVGMGSAL